MIKIHVISDLWLDSNEWNNPEDEVIPECDLVIFNGNCGDINRSMILFELLCKKYPEKQFIYNEGIIDAPYQKTKTQLADGLRARQLYSDLWPKNLHYRYRKPMMLEIKGTVLDVFCLRGYPKVADHVQDDTVWRSTIWYRWCYHGVTHDQKVFKAPEAADVYHGHWPIWSTPNLCREEHDSELEEIETWLKTPSDGNKILITATSPFNDPNLKGIEYTMYQGIFPDYWFVGGAEINTKIGKCVLYGNPGSGKFIRNTVCVMEDR
jgi:hypothetical protein